MPIAPAALAAYANPIEDDAVEAPPEEGGDTEEGGPGKFGLLLTLLEANADDVMALTEEFDPDQLTDGAQELDEEEQAALRDGAMTLPEDLQNELGTALPGVGLDETREVASHLESEGIIDDAERLAGWLFRLGEIGMAPAEGEDDAEDSDEDADEEMDEDELGGFEE